MRISGSTKIHQIFNLNPAVP
uniref:Uncharacterized protein n=1 Tax=Anguilla anguilla TaxID=7936 RepID=A0A0E9TUJ8_ANGAN